MFLRAGAVLENDHFVLTSGRHVCHYIDKRALYRNPQVMADLASDISINFLDRQNIGVYYDAVIASEVGGIALAQWVAYNSAHRTKVGADILAVTAEKKEGEFVFRAGDDDAIRGKNVLAVEDNLTTGRSLQRLIGAARRLECKVLGAAALCNLGGVIAAILGVPMLHALLEPRITTWTDAECPMCLANMPVNERYGHGAEFVALQSR